ncbi:MAG: DUF2007 domain-containing protein [Alphaproteobacteria bacterium]|uniref:putative signal transducing protein n=1 Tax=Maricaulis alexandrii TaxID=2570354 RepID=UPI001109BBDF|nr:DUF2007 domain-containing protein [Maricaulis alexandrii]MCR9267412.1 DUF2007 domain-containing protein [Alphaproteobacteria bacterium]
MKDILKTPDPVKLSFAQSVLNDAGIGNFVLDEGMSNLYGGGIEFVTKRLAVSDEDAVEAERLLAEAFREAGDE